MKPTPVLLTTDIVLFAFNPERQLQILLIQRKNPPFKNCWALPGGFVDPNEDLLPCALRELEEETGVRLKSMNQLGAYGDPNRDERGRVVTVAYWAELSERVEVFAADDAKDARWFLVDKLPELAFDHGLIIADSMKKRSQAI